MQRSEYQIILQDTTSSAWKRTNYVCNIEQYLIGFLLIRYIIDVSSDAKPVYRRLGRLW